MNLRKVARGQECQVRLPGVCNWDPQTTILAHLPGGGMGRKQHDLIGAWSCSDCHDAVDRRNYRHLDYEYVRTAHLEGMARTLLCLVERGVFDAL